MRTDARASERGFTLIEVMVAIVLTAIATFGIAGAVMGAMHARADNDLRAMLDDDALAVLSDVRMMTAYDANMLAKVARKNATMTRTLPGGDTETLAVSVTVTPTVPAREIATAVASDGALRATERIELYQHAPAPGSTVDQ